ncbi:twin-arginine translocation signal domain-containing protein [Duodenibacillus massiliensis]|uniref:twin-arginine translocation signal domain-containing protein n=1 Tax=Duodenibacillus massiliensis TaxID=1852381 RepID=UPI000A8D4FF7|nr:twin-arginine translocation signal domain-containing protein [Duodenibacillus massiliensis]
MSDISRRSFLSAVAAAGSLPAVSAAKASQKFDLTTDVLIAGGRRRRLHGRG